MKYKYIDYIKKDSKIKNVNNISDRIKRKGERKYENKSMMVIIGIVLALIINYVQIQYLQMLQLS